MRRVIVLLAVVYTLYFAQSFLIPVVLSLLCSLLLSPFIRKLKRIGIPRTISATCMLSLLIGPIILLLIKIAEPAERWLEIAPEISSEIFAQIEDINNAITGEKKTSEPSDSGGFFGLFKSEEPEPPANEKNLVEERIREGGVEVLISLAAATPLVLAQVLACLVLTLFLLIFGPAVFNALISYSPAIADKNLAVTLTSSVQQALAKYITTISLINCALGVVTAVVLHWLNVSDPLLWGALVGLLNFVPYLGSTISLSVLVIVGIVQYGFEWIALLPSGLVFLLNLIEAQFVTPMVLGNSMKVNPLIIILWLFATGWLWGPVGVLIGLPLLVCVKLVLAEFETSAHWVKIIESR